MTALKAHEVAKYLGKPDQKTGIFLSYGTDPGLVRETARRLGLFCAGKDPDPMSMITFDAQELDADPSKLAVEARTPSLFGGTRVIRVRNASKSLTTTLSELLDDMPDAAIILEAGNLNRRDALRALAESHKQARALPCYADNDESLGRLIRQHFADTGINIESDVTATLISLLGNDREVTRRELEKLTLFALESKTLTVEDVVILCGDNAALALDQIVDSVGTGHAAAFDDAMTRAAASGTAPQRILAVALMHFANLRRMRAQVDAGKQPRDVLNGSRPRPHFSRTSALERQLRLWSDDNLAAACARLYDAIAQSRKAATLDIAITHRALLALCIAAGKR